MPSKCAGGLYICLLFVWLSNFLLMGYTANSMETTNSFTATILQTSQKPTNTISVGSTSQIPKGDSPQSPNSLIESTNFFNFDLTSALVLTPSFNGVSTPFSTTATSVLATTRVLSQRGSSHSPLISNSTANVSTAIPTTVTPTVITPVMSDLSSVQTSTNSTTENMSKISTSLDLDFTATPTPLLKSVSMISTTTALFSTTGISPKIEPRNSMLTYSPPPIINTTLPIPATLTVAIIGRNSTANVSRTVRSTVNITSVMSDLPSLQTSTNSTIGNTSRISTSLAPVSTQPLNSVRMISPFSTTTTLLSSTRISSKLESRNPTLPYSLPTMINLTSIITTLPLSATLKPHLSGNESSVSATTTIHRNSSAAVSRTVRSAVITSVSVMSDPPSVQTSTNSTIGNTSRISTSLAPVSTQPLNSVRTISPFSTTTTLLSSTRVLSKAEPRNSTLPSSSPTIINVTSVIPSLPISTTLTSHLTGNQTSVSSIARIGRNSTANVSKTVRSTVITSVMSNLSSVQTSTNSTIGNQLTSTPVSTPSLNTVSNISYSSTTRTLSSNIQALSETRARNSTLASSPATINVTSIMPSLPISATSTPDLHGNQSSVSTVTRIGRNSTANVSRTVRSTVITSVMSNLSSVQTRTNSTIGNQLTSTPVSTLSFSPVSNISPFSSTTKTLSSTIQASSETRARNSTLASSPATINVTSIMPSLPISATSTPDLHGNQSSVSTIARISRNSTANVSRTVRSTVITPVMSNLSSVQISTNSTIGNQLTSTPVSTPSLNTVSIKSPSSTTRTLSGTMIDISSETRVRNSILTSSPPTINVTSITPYLPITATLGSDLRGNQSSIKSTTMISIFSSANSSSAFFLTRSRTIPSTLTTSVMSNLPSVQTGTNSTIGNTSKISTSLVFTLPPVSTPLLNSVTMISPPSKTTDLLSPTAISSKIVPRNSTLPSLSRTIITVTPILPSLQVSTTLKPHLSENQSLVSANKTTDRNSTATVFLETPRAVRSTVITPLTSSTNSTIVNQLNMSATYGLTSTPVSTSSLNTLSIISPSTTTTLSSTMIEISSEFRTRNLTVASSLPSINVTSITPSLPISATLAPDPHGNQSSVSTTTLFSLFSSGNSSPGFFLTRSRIVPSTVITSVMSNISSVKTSANPTIGNTPTSLDFTTATVSTLLLKSVSMISPSSTTTILLSFTRVSSKIEARNYTLPSSPPTIINVTSITPSLPIAATLTPHPSGNQSSVGVITIIGTNSTGTVFLDTSRAELSTITTSVMSNLSSVQTSTNSIIGNQLNMSATYVFTSTPVSTPSLNPFSIISPFTTTTLSSIMIEISSEERTRNSTVVSLLPIINVTSITPSPISATLTPDLQGNQTRSVNSTTLVSLFSITNSTTAFVLTRSRTVPSTIVTSMLSNLSPVQTSSTSRVKNTSKISTSYNFTSAIFSRPSSVNLMSPSSVRDSNETVSITALTHSYTVRLGSSVSNKTLVQRTLSTFGVSVGPSSTVTTASRNLSSLPITSEASTIVSVFHHSTVTSNSVALIVSSSLNANVTPTPQLTSKPIFTTRIILATTRVSSEIIRSNHSSLVFSQSSINVTSITLSLPISVTSTPDLHGNQSSVSTIAIIGRNSTANVSRTVRSTVITSVMSNLSSVQTSTNSTIGNQLTSTPVSTPSLSPVSNISPFSSTTKTLSSTIQALSETRARNSTLAFSPVTINVTSITSSLPLISATLTPHLTGNQSSVGSITTISTSSTFAVSMETSRTVPSTVMTSVMSNLSSVQTGTNSTIGNKLNMSATYVFTSTSVSTLLLKSVTVISSSFTTSTVLSPTGISSKIEPRNSTLPSSPPTIINVTSITPSLPISATLTPHLTGNQSSVGAITTFGTSSTFAVSMETSRTVRSTVITSVMSDLSSVQTSTNSTVRNKSKSSVSKTIISASQISGITLVSVSYNRTTRMPERSTLHIADASSSQLLPTSQLRSSESQVTSKIIRLSSTMASYSNGLESSHVIATASSSSIQLSITSDPLSSCHSCSDMLSITAAVSSSIPTSRSTLSVSDEYKLQVLLLIPTSVELDDSFKTDMERKLENQYDLGVRQSTLTRQRRAVNKFQMPRHEIHRAQKYNDINGDEINVRVKRQTANETTVKILNITRDGNSRQNVVVVFYVSSGGKLVEATSAEKTLNTPSKAETVAELGYQVDGKFSAASSKEVEPGKKKRNETLFIVLAVTLPFLFVLLSCIFIKCKKRKKSKKMKLNKVSVHDAERGDHRKEQASERKSSFEERYTRAPELPVKDYAKDGIKKTREKLRSKKEPKPYSVPNTQKENALVTPASAFENITRMSYEGSSNVATIDEIPLRFRPAFRQDIEQTSKVPTEQDIVEESGVPRSWMEKKQMVDLHSRSDEKINNKKVSPAMEQDGGDSRAKIRTVELENTDGDSDDTMQIKANIEKWRNKMRQKEKRKEKREERRRLEEDKLIALEQRKLSRRDWLMAQPEIQAILEGDDLPTASSLRKKTYRQKRWRGSEHPSYSESENEGMVVPVRNKKRRRRWPRRAKQVFPAEQDGIRLVSVRPSKQRVYAFEEPVVNEPEIDPRYSQPQSESSSVYQRTPSPMIPEGYEEEDNEENSYDNTYEDEYLDPFVPQYHDPRYLEQPVLVPRYLTTSEQTLIQHNLPLRMQETSLTSTPRMSRPLSSDNVNTKHPRTLYYDERHPRPSTLYTSAGRRTKQNFSSEPPLHHVDNSDGRRTRSNAENLPSPRTARKSNSRVVRNDMETVAERSEPKTVEAEMRNYNISENEAKTLVARVLQRAARNNVHST